MKHHHKLLLALIAGALLGILFHGVQSEFITTAVTNVLDPIGQVFLRLIFMVVVPLVFSGLVLGVFELSSHQGLGRVVRRTIFFTIISSTASVLIGVTLVQVLRPGDHVQISAQVIQEQTSSLDKIKSNVALAKSPVQSIVELIPKNPLAAATQALEGEMLALMVFALIFGAALSITLPKDKPSSLMDLLNQIYQGCMQVVHFAMKLAPLAIFSLIFVTSFKLGHQILVSLAYYVGVVLLGLLIQNFGVYSLMLRIFTRVSPPAFFKSIRDVLLYAFATASSNATLPRTLETATSRLHLNPESSRFVLTVGSTANQNGTALFEGITVLFLAQIYHVDLTFAQQVQVVFMSILAGVGTAGVPGGSLPLIMILLQQVGVPPEGLGIILGVDRLLDMARTAVNVSGDLVIAQLVDEKS